MSEPVRVQLKYPISRGSETISERTLRRPQFGDIDGCEIVFGEAGAKVSMEILRKIAGRAAGQPDDVMRKLDMVDAMEVSGVVLGFLGLSLPTGGTPSDS